MLKKYSLENGIIAKVVEKINISLLHEIIAKMIREKINPSYTELSRKWSRSFIYKGIFDFAIIPYNYAGTFEIR